MTGAEHSIGGGGTKSSDVDEADGQRADNECCDGVDGQSSELESESTALSLPL